MNTEAHVDDLVPLVDKALLAFAPILEEFGDRHSVKRAITTNSYELQTGLKVALVELGWDAEEEAGHRKRRVGIGLDSTELVFAYVGIDDGVMVQNPHQRVYLTDPDWQGAIRQTLEAFTTADVWTRQ